MKIALVLLLVIHGCIHLLGVVKGFGLAQLPQLRCPVGRSAAGFWLAAALLLAGAGAMLLLKSPFWAFPAGAGVVLSQVLIVMSWSDAKFGTAANLLLLLPAVAGISNALPSSYVNRYQADGEQRLATFREPGILAEQDLAALPPPVQRYLRFAGVVGKPKVVNFRVAWKGSMRTKVGGDWMPIEARQVNFLEPPARLFYIESSMFGIPFDGYHAYVGNAATMQIKIGGLMPVADARGPEMNRGETVTMFNDMCLIAPATLVSPSIRWEEIDSLHVRGIFTNAGNSISAVLTFDPSGALKNFVSNDRYLSEDGTSYENYPWSTPVGEIKEFCGTKVSAGGEAIWHMPRGDYAYGRFTIVELEYNCRAE